MEVVNSSLPVQIKQSGNDTLEIHWSDGHLSRYQVRRLRLACRCAHCVDEWNGTVKITANQVPADVRPVAIDGVGRYGIKISWSDGHNVGIYSYDYLRSLCNCEKCKKS